MEVGASELEKSAGAVGLERGEVTVERAAYAAGSDAGRDAGARAGDAEGHDVGCRHGFELAAEVGFVAGAARVWQWAAEQDSHPHQERYRRAAAALGALLAHDPLADVRDPALHERLDSLRARFKAASASLHGPRPYGSERASGGAAGGGAGTTDF